MHHIQFILFLMAGHCLQIDARAEPIVHGGASDVADDRVEKTVESVKDAVVVGVKTLRPEPIVLVHGGAGDVADDRVEKTVESVKDAVAVGVKTLKPEPIVLVHGGAGDVADDRVEKTVESVKDAVVVGIKTLKPEPIVLVHGGAGDVADDRVEKTVESVKDAVVVGVKTLKPEPIVLVHGGAGDVADDRVEKTVESVKDAVVVGIKTLKPEPIVLVHGGAGDVADDRVKKTVEGVKDAVVVGFKVLLNSGTVLDAVEAAVNSMEDNPILNAGTGSVLNLDGEVAMDSSIQRGSDLMSGGVTLIKHFKNPVSLAKHVLLNSPHAMLGGEGAEKFAIKEGFQAVSGESLISSYALEDYRSIKVNGSIFQSTKSNIGGTTGSVAIDAEGHIAAATSTGGLNGKWVGRIGDTPLIGAGTYADDLIGGCSITGHGESIQRVVLAHTIIKYMESGLSAQEAAQKGLNYMTRKLNNTAGAICISKSHELGIHFTTTRMPWSYIRGNQRHWGINPGEHFQEDYNLTLD